MMGRRQVTPGWANDPVWRHDVRQGRDGRVTSGKPLLGEHRVAGGKGWIRLKKNSYVEISDGA